MSQGKRSTYKNQLYLFEVAINTWNSSVNQSCPTLCDPMDCSTLLSITSFQTRFKLRSIKSVMPPIQPSHPLSSPSPPAFNHSQYQGLFQWVSSSHQVAKVLKLHLQQQYFKWIFRTDMLEDWLLWSPCSPKDSQESSPTPQFKSINSSVLSCLYSPTLISIESMMPSNHLILCHPLLPSSLFLSIRVFSSESVLRIRWPKYWNLNFSISPCNEYSRLISFRIDWLISL